MSSHNIPDRFFTREGMCDAEGVGDDGRTHGSGRYPCGYRATWTLRGSARADGEYCGVHIKDWKRGGADGRGVRERIVKGA